MPRLLSALRVFAALTDSGLRPHAGRVSVFASWVPMPLCASWARRCGGQGPPFLFGFPLFFLSCFSFCARSLRPLAARSLHRLASSRSNALSSGSAPWPSVPPLVMLVELPWISRWLLSRSVGRSVLAVQENHSYQRTQKRYVPYFLQPKNIPSMTSLKNSRMRMRWQAWK
ncbi:uncharacterized protein LOC125538736 isoform X2 [Triticum urartu]|uniref:uncharacterized protein LOC125538736 isoform X2 n=1 Tax=Triticum urartu TaxID=4572 RepID=UPI002042FAF0|nr:uncharacterized protein LOC125538736 isoform X2 [Triticum urartu]